MIFANLGDTWKGLLSLSTINSSAPPFKAYNKHLAKFALAPKNCISLPTLIEETQHAIQ